MLLTSGLPMASQVSTKSKKFDDFEHLVLSRISAVSNGNKSKQQPGSCLKTSKYHPKLSESIFKVEVIQGHEVNERSN